MGAIMDTASKYVFPSFIENKDEVHDKLSWFFETYIVALRGRSNTNYEIFLITDLGEAHTNKIIKTCRKYGILKQSTAGYTPDHNAFSERYFRTVGEMSRCQMLQFDSEEELWEDSRYHAVWLINRLPPSKFTDDKPWLSPQQRQFPDRKVTDLTKLQPFGITCWTHIKKARRPGKSDSNPRGEKGILVGYDDEQGPLLARIYFPDTGIFELHDNSYIRYQSLHAELERKAEASPVNTTPVKDVSDYKYLIGTRHVDPESGLTYETTEIKVAPNKDIIAWRKRVYNGKLDKNSQGPFYAEDIRLYTQVTLKSGIPQ